MLRYLTAGESHGPGLVAVVEGVPAGLAITADDLATFQHHLLSDSELLRHLEAI